MAHTDILDRLRIDPGQRTLGQLMQDRETAIHEIGRLRAEIERLRTSRIAQRPAAETSERAAQKPAFPPGALIKLADVCELLGISRSTVYQRVSAGTFPPPVHVGPRAVRWRIEEIEAWRDAPAIRSRPLASK